jgi:hypothetical protein
MAHLPENLAGLHSGEEFLRTKAIEALADDRLRLHAEMIEQAMNMADGLRQFETEDEDLKLIQVLGMRTFNDFGAAVKLCLSGYYQNAALILRDVLETTFLIDLFRGDRTLIAQWRLADKASRLRDFKPVRVRTLLDNRDGLPSASAPPCTPCFPSLPVTQRCSRWQCCGPRGWMRRSARSSTSRHSKP